jgi:CubicO group peptidase (beta-lactamase class C family)
MKVMKVVLRVMLALFMIALLSGVPHLRADRPLTAPESVGFSAAYGTWFWLDPTNDVVVIGMMQNVNGSSPTGGSPQVRPLSRQLVYQALVDRHK